jgi:hypothetical protein
MPTAIQLIPLQCFKCSTPIPAGLEEVAWVCPTCGQGLLVSAERGTAPLDVHFSAGLTHDRPGRPFWVARGLVTVSARQTYGSGDSSRESAAFWSGGRSFFIPAYACTLDELLELGGTMLRQAPALQPDPSNSPVAFQPVVTHPEDARPYAEFIVMAVEAARSDKLRELKFDLTLTTPELWVLPG